MKKEKCNCSTSKIGKHIFPNTQRTGILPTTSIPCEPKMEYRYVVSFPEKFEIEPYVVQKLSLPSEINGKWRNISMEFLDLIVPSTSLKLFNFIKEQNTIFNKIKRFFLKNNIMFSFKIELLDPTGCTTGKWFIDVKKIAYISYGEVDYSKDGLLKIFVDFEIKNCNLVNAV